MAAAGALAAMLQPKMASSGSRPEDGVEDMTKISDIDVQGVNKNLEVRYNRNEVYTYTGTILVAVNPYKVFPIYTNEIMAKYQNKKMSDMPPHVYAVAEAAYVNVQRANKNQSCVISGESGAGKTETTKFILMYLCTVTSSATSWVEQQILECNVILEAFGNAKTIKNDNSSRFGKFMQVCFNNNMEIKGMIVEEYLLEQSRITNQAPNERNYHVFYSVVCGGDKTKYLLDPVESYTFLNQSGCYKLDGIDDKKDFEALCMAMTVLNIEEEVQEGIFMLVSAVLHIGNVVFKDHDEHVTLNDKDKVEVAKAAKLLQIKETSLQEALVSRQIIVKGATTTIPFKLIDARENSRAMAKALYSRTFTWLVDQINQTTNPGANTAKFIGVLDIFGFENFKVNSFEQLCINFTNEKLHKFFNHYVFALEQEEYKKEAINFGHIKFTDNTLCLELIEKPPAAVLRLLDEECRFPKGTDNTFLEKQHAALEAHPNYIKGENKSRWNQEFGIRHFAGDVVYQITGFLDKNRDVMQDQLFDAMRLSPNKFISDLPRFQNMLVSERKEQLAVNKSISRKESLSDGMRTNKQKPTVGDTFRRQLASLVEVLDETTPWYVRCIKPNQQKKPNFWDVEMITAQLNYSGMLDIVRIRKEGFPVHVPCETFLQKYACIATMSKLKLSADPKQATKEILTLIKAPTTEWQIGKTKVFLRNTIFEPLEEQMRKMLLKTAVSIQRVWKGYIARRKFKALKSAMKVVQAAIRGGNVRMRFVQHLKAAIRIQAWVRGCFAREVVKEMLRVKRAAEAKRKKEEQERREKELREQGEKIMEESFLAVQKELYAMASVAELKAKELSATAAGGKSMAVDALFVSLSKEAPKGADAKYLSQISSEMDKLFNEAPDPKQLAPGARTMRRKKRVDAKIAEQKVEAEEEEKDVNPEEYTMLKYAEKYFNQHPKNTGGSTAGRSALKNNKAVSDPMPLSELIVYAKSGAIATSLIHLHNPENVNLACNIFKDVCKDLKGDLKPVKSVQLIQSTVAHCLSRPELRDEIFCQLIKQTTNNPKADSAVKAWEILCCLCVSFPPSKILYNYLKVHLSVNQRDSAYGKYATWCSEVIKKVKSAGPRRLAPSITEVEKIKTLQPIICRFYFLDGKAKALGVQPWWTSTDTIEAIGSKINLADLDGWALFEASPQSEHFIRGQEYMGDILAEWERDHRESMQLSKYQTVSRKGSFNEAIGEGESRFVFRRRLFKKPRVIPTDPVEYGLMYAQAVHSVVRVDEFPVNDKVALQLAGLQAQITWGEADESKLSRYEEVPTYIPWRLRQQNRAMSKADWVKAIFMAHRDYGTGKTDLQAKVLYLTAVKQYPLYGGTFFEAVYKGFWMYPARILVCVAVDGIKFVNYMTKEVFVQFGYDKLKSLEVNTYEDTLTMVMNNAISPAPAANAGEAPAAAATGYMFVCSRKEDVAGLISSYSPTHRNWKQIGVAQVSSRKAGDDQKGKLLYEVQRARLQLAQGNILMKPDDSKLGSLATTLRRRLSKTTISPVDQAKGATDMDLEQLEKIYDSRYWAYSKSRLSQPLTQMTSEDGPETALKAFTTTLIFAGLASEGGFELPDDPGYLGMLQNLIGQCLEKEDVCNEIYLQVIKQTTDQPEVNGHINIQNWRILTLISCIVVPRQRLILNYLQAHLKRCCSEPGSEEGRFAHFVTVCVSRTLENKNRKYPPSKQEILCVGKRAPIHARFFFMDNEFRSLMFDSAATTAEVLTIVKSRIELPPAAQGFSLFEVFGSLERNMLPWEKVGDAMFKWEKYAKSTHSPKELRLTFKKRLFTGPYSVPKSLVEFDLVTHQGFDDIRNDRFPLTVADANKIVAWAAQSDGDLESDLVYEKYIEAVIPKHLRSEMPVADIANEHKKLKGSTEKDCRVKFLQFVMSWPLYGSTVFEVLQSYTTTLPKNLWLAVNENGIAILRRRAAEPLISYSYRDIVNYSPSLRNLMIVTESLTKGTKFVFNTSQASQIAHLMKDYTHLLIQKKQQEATDGKAPSVPGVPTGFDEDDERENKNRKNRHDEEVFGFE